MMKFPNETLKLSHWQSKVSFVSVFLVGGQATHLNNIGQVGSFPQTGVQTKTFETTTSMRNLEVRINGLDFFLHPLLNEVYWGI